MTRYIAAAIAAAALASLSTSAWACPNGYKRVWIHNNPVCVLDASASNTLKPNTQPKQQTQNNLKQLGLSLPANANPTRTPAR